MYALEIRDLRVHYHMASEVRKAIDGVSLTLNRGEALGVVGRSGSGKSVLARAVLGLIGEPGRVSGEILLRERNILAMSEPELERLRGKDVALILSNPLARLSPLISVGNQIANALRAKQPLTRVAARAKAISLLSSVEIADPARVANSLPSTLSGGMCQRVIIAMALANEPQLLVADEPTAGLDVTVQRQVLELIVNLMRQQGAALLLMTRDLGVVAHYCQRVAVLKDGQIVETQPVASFFDNPQHPHSKFLLRAAFAARGEDAEVATEGSIWNGDSPNP
jgi:ABC-type dipeptide/oligopeptide/nickel transport system ATPase component